jgi:hypothetical protein
VPTSFRPTTICTQGKENKENGTTTAAYHKKMEKDGEYKTRKLFKSSTERKMISTRLQTS